MQSKTKWVIPLLAVLFVFASMAAAAAVTIANVDEDGYYVYVAPGQSVVGEQQLVEEEAIGELAEGEVIYIDLPDGLVFDPDSPPVASVTEGDLTLDDGGVPGNTNIEPQLVNDNTRAIWTVYSASQGDDNESTITITNMKVTLASDYDFGNNTAVNLVLTIGAGTTIDNDNVVAVAVPELASPAQTLAAATLKQTKDDQDASDTQIVLTLPAGTAEEDTVTLTLPSGQTFGGSPTAVVLNDSETATVDATIDDGGLALTVAGDIVNDTQVLLIVDTITTEDAPLGDLNAELGGTAGLSGSVKVAEVAASGTTNEVVDEELKDITRGAQHASAVSNFTLTEIFPDDLTNGGKFTITLPEGLTFNDAGNAEDSDTDLSANERTITVTVAATGDQDTITISSLEVNAASTFTGSQVEVTLANDATESAGITEGTLVLANVVDPQVTVTGPDPVPVVGIGAEEQELGQATIEEATYGSIRLGQTIQLNAPEGVTITEATIDGEANGLELTDLDDSTDGFQAFIAPDGSYAYWTVVSESTDAESLTLDVTADIDASVAPGTELGFTFTGESNITGDVTLATVQQATTTSRSTGIPTVTPGETDAQAIATITIEENFASALSDGKIRVIAPAGVTFPSNTSSFTLGTGVGSPQVISTFNPADTVVLELSTSADTDTFNIGLACYIAEGVSGNIAFKIVDGDGAESGTGTGITEVSSIVLAYAGTAEEMAANPASATVTVGGTAEVAVTGGVGDYSVTSSDEEVATATVSDGTVTITGVAEGSATITVSDSADPANTVDIAVTVQTLMAIGGEPGATEVTQPADENLQLLLNITNDDDVAYEDIAQEWLVLAGSINGQYAGFWFIKADGTIVDFDTANADPSAVTFSFDHSSDTYNVATLPLGDLGMVSGDYLAYGYVYSTSEVTDFLNAPDLSLENYVIINVQ